MDLRPVPWGHPLARMRRGRASLLSPCGRSVAAWGRSGSVPAVAAVSRIGGGRCARRCAQPITNPLLALTCYRPAKAITDGRWRSASTCEKIGRPRTWARAAAPARTHPRPRPRAPRVISISPRKRKSAFPENFLLQLVRLSFTDPAASSSQDEPASNPLHSSLRLHRLLGHAAFGAAAGSED